LQAADIPYLSVNPNQMPEPDEIRRLLAEEGIQA
jgi:hypothetical protein